MAKAYLQTEFGTFNKCSAVTEINLDRNVLSLDPPPSVISNQTQSPNNSPPHPTGKRETIPPRQLVTSMAHLKAERGNKPAAPAPALSQPWHPYIDHNGLTKSKGAAE